MDRLEQWALGMRVGIALSKGEAMSHLSEPDADRMLDEGSKPPVACAGCGDELLPAEGTVCANCIEEDEMARRDDGIPDEDAETTYLRALGLL